MGTDVFYSYCRVGVCMHVYRPKIAIRCLPQSLYLAFWDKFSMNLKPINSPKLSDRWVLGICSAPSSSEGVIQFCCQVLPFYMWTRDIFHGCWESELGVSCSRSSHITDGDISRGSSHVRGLSDCDRHTLTFLLKESSTSFHPVGLILPVTALMYRQESLLSLWGERNKKGWWERGRIVLHFFSHV